MVIREVAALTAAAIGTGAGAVAGWVRLLQDQVSADTWVPAGVAVACTLLAVAVTWRIAAILIGIQKDRAADAGKIGEIVAKLERLDGRVDGISRTVARLEALRASGDDP